MSKPAEMPRWRRRWFERLEDTSPRALLPSWALSLAFHAGMFFLLATMARSCGSTVGDGVQGDFRQVGLYVKPAESNQPSDSLEATEEAANEPAFPAAAQPTDRPAVDNSPPVPLSTPAPQTPIIGGGAATPSVAPRDIAEFSRPNRVGRPAAAAAGGVGQSEVPFFGIRDKGTRFVYVLECSGSMAGSPILVAKSELMASLQSLESTQQFQIIFYNQTPREMTLQGDRRTQLHWGTDINKTLARQFIASVQPDLGTDHMPALKKALRLTPEVIFFLTDADEPQLTAAERDDIRRTNGGKTRIHCIEFGKGAKLRKVESFLEKVARENGGTYRYRDVSQFERRG